MVTMATSVRIPLQPNNGQTQISSSSSEPKVFIIKRGKDKGVWTIFTFSNRRLIELVPVFSLEDFASELMELLQNSEYVVEAVSLSKLQPLPKHENLFFVLDPIPHIQGDVVSLKEDVTWWLKFNELAVALINYKPRRKPKKKSLTVKTESLPKRCEVCHKTDCFDAAKNYCSRCANSLARVREKIKNARANMQNTQAQQRVTTRSEQRQNSQATPSQSAQAQTLQPSSAQTLSKQWQGIFPSLIKASCVIISIIAGWTSVYLFNGTAELIYILQSLLLIILLTYSYFAWAWKISAKSQTDG